LRDLERQSDALPSTTVRGRPLRNVIDAVALPDKPLGGFENRCAMASRTTRRRREMHAIHSPVTGRFRRNDDRFRRENGVSEVDCGFMTAGEED